MQQVKLTFAYLKKAFPALFVAAVVPAVVLGFFSQPFASLTFLPMYIKGANGHFVDFFAMLIAGQSLWYIFPILMIIGALIASCSYCLSLIEKHFKTGKLALHSPLRSMNNSVLSVLKVFPIALVVCALLMLMQTGLVSLIRVIFTGVRGYPTVLDCVWTSVISLLVYLVMVAVTVFMGVWVVIIQIFGFSLSDAFVEAMRVVSKKWLSFIGGLVVPVTIILIPQILLNAIFDGMALAKMLVSMAGYALIFMYYSAYIMVSVYSLTGLERRDQKSVVPKK